MEIPSARVKSRCEQTSFDLHAGSLRESCLHAKIANALISLLGLNFQFRAYHRLLFPSPAREE